MQATTRQQLILEHYPLVRAIARRMARRFPGSVDVDDLVSIGVLGLIDSADRFDNSRTVAFSAYARIRIQGAIVDAMRKADFVPRSVRQRARNLAHQRERLAAALGRNPTPDEMAEEYGISVEQFRELERNTQLATLVSMDEQRSDSDDRLSDSIPSGEASPADLAEESGVRERVTGATQVLQPRDQDIVRLYYYEDLSLCEIGQVLGVTESRVSQLHSRIKNRLTETLAA